MAIHRPSSVVGACGRHDPVHGRSLGPGVLVAARRHCGGSNHSRLSWWRRYRSNASIFGGERRVYHRRGANLHQRNVTHRRSSLYMVVQRRPWYGGHPGGIDIAFVCRSALGHLVGGRELGNFSDAKDGAQRRRKAVRHRKRGNVCSIAGVGAMVRQMTHNNALERTVKHCGPRLSAASASWPAAQLGR
jgi:hypothetical protein